VAGNDLTADSTLDLQFPACLAADFPRELPVAEAAVERVLATVSGASFESLEQRSPGLKGNDWSNYLRCSVARMVHAAGALRRKGVPDGRLLDYGAYFGNFALMFAELGYAVDAIDSYRSYETALHSIVDLFSAAGVRPLDFEAVGRDLHDIAPATYDVVLCMGVVEHIPHTPRLLLEALDRVLKPGGVLLLETPNLAHLYNRQKLARGDAIMTPIAQQYYATLPFEGHHREYTVGEVVWMAEQLGHQVLVTELFNYSAYNGGTLVGRDVTNHWRMVAEPTMREIILVVSRKPVEDRSPAVSPDWTSTYEEVEHYWQRLAPPRGGHEEAEAIIETELLLVELQHAVQIRDGLLANYQRINLELQDGIAQRDQEIVRRDRETVHEISTRDQEISRRDRETIQEISARDQEIVRRDRETRHEIGRRDQIIRELNADLGALKQKFDAKLSERLKRQWRRLLGQPEP
jgi:2-polyprenyl-3-methyl-5-hydroxy-6-metoxy-1,4-benzoquinol methylase